MLTQKNLNKLFSLNSNSHDLINEIIFNETKAEKNGYKKACSLRNFLLLNGLRRDTKAILQKIEHLKNNL